MAKKINLLLGNVLFPENLITYNDSEENEISALYDYYKADKSGDKDFDPENFANFLYSVKSIIEKIQNQLLFDYRTEGKDICHYTGIETLKHIIKYREDKKANLRLSNVAYMNDPSEGRIFIDMLNGFSTANFYKGLFGLGHIPNNKREDLNLSNVYIGSFSTAINTLPMWTLYGDKSKGCCLVFDDNYFAEPSYSEDTTKTPETILTLYKVHYVDVKSPEKSELHSDLKKLAELITGFANLITADSKIRGWVMNYLESIRFLFKSTDYKYEDEVRIILHPKPNEISIDDSASIPKIYSFIQKQAKYKEVILGSKIERPSEIAPFLIHSGVVKKVSKSGIEYQ